MARQSNFDRAFNKAIIRAANKLLLKGRTATTKRVREVYNIKASDLKTRTLMYRASRSQPDAYLVFRGKGMRLYLFSPKTKQVKSGKRTYKQVSVEIRKGRRKIVKGGFIGAKRVGNVWKRLGKTRYDIVPLFTLSSAQMVEQVGADIWEKIIKRDLLDTFMRELAYELGKL